MQGDDFFRKIKRLQIPDKPPEIFLEDSYSEQVDLFGEYKAYHYGRSFCTDRGMWAVVTNSWVKELADWIDGRSVLELMSGTGWLAKALSENGVNVHATDNNSWLQSGRHLLKPIVEVENIDAVEAAEKYANTYDVFLCSWPYMDDTVYHAAMHLQGKTFVYIGEPIHGCTASTEFFKIFYEDKNQPVKKFWQWRGMHDYVAVGKIGNGR